jgi:translation initiation factor 3 subunit D
MMKDPNRPILRIYAVPGEDDLDAEFEEDAENDQDDAATQN